MNDTPQGALEDLGIKGCQHQDGLWVLNSPHVVTSTTGQLFAEGKQGLKEITHIMSKDDVCQVTGDVTMASPMDNLNVVGGQLNALASIKSKVKADIWIQPETTGG